MTDVILTATGGDQFILIPSGCTALDVFMHGSASQTFSTSLGSGSAIWMSTRIPVTPGEILRVKAGTMPSSSSFSAARLGGWPDGGNGGSHVTTSRNGVGGSGSTSIYRGSTLLAIAGGSGGTGIASTGTVFLPTHAGTGGGNGFSGFGGDGDSIYDGFVIPDPGGLGGTWTAGGSGGITLPQFKSGTPNPDPNAIAGSAGAFLLGATAPAVSFSSPLVIAGSGGGGGYYGGGSGSARRQPVDAIHTNTTAGSCGGGGSSWADPTLTQNTAYNVFGPLGSSFSANTGELYITYVFESGSSNVWYLGLVGRATVSTVIPTRIERLPAAILALGPLAYWPLGETGGPTAADITGNGHDGTYSSDVVFGERVDGFDHQVPNFWKTTSFVTVPDFNEASLDTNGITVLALVQVSNSLVGASPSGITPFLKNNEWACSFPSFHSFASETNTSSSLFRATENVATAIGSSFTLHVWVYPSSSTLDPIIYNSATPSGSSVAPTGTRNGNTTNPLIIGAGHGNLTSHSTTKGRFMNNTAFYNRVLTVAEITTLFAAYALDYP